jgi:hypothetical protein
MTFFVKSGEGFDQDEFMLFSRRSSGWAKGSEVNDVPSNYVDGGSR